MKKEKRQANRIRRVETSNNAVTFWVIGAAVFLSLVVFLPLSYDWLGVNKVTVLRVGVPVALLVWSAGYTRVPTVRRSTFDIPVIAFLVSASLSTLFSLHPPTSLIGEYYRYQGFSTLILYGLLYFLAVQVASASRRESFLFALIILGGLISFYGILQYLGMDFISWGIRWESNRSFSTLGNPVFLGGFLSLVLPIAVGEWLVAERRQAKTVLGICTLLILTALLATFSRGAWIAGLAGLLSFPILFRRKKQLIKKLWVLSLVMLGVLVLLIISSSIANQTEGKRLTFTERIAGLKNIKEGSPGTRLLIWRSTLELVRQRPTLGWGPDSFPLVYPKVSSLEEARAEGYLKLADNAHSYPLQIAATQGLLGLWALLVIAVLTLGLFRRIPLESGNEGVLVGAMWLGLLSYFVYLLSGIMSVETGALFWVVLGLFSFSLRAKDKRSTQRAAPETRKAVSRWAVVAVVLVVAAVTGVSMSLYLADVYFGRASRALKAGLPEEAESNYRLAMRLNPWLELYPRHLGRMYKELAVDAGSEDLLQAGIAAYLEAERINPFPPDNYGFLGDLYLVGGQLFDQRYYRLAEDELRKALELYPYWADVRTDLGMLYYLKGFSDKAVRELDQALLIYPSHQKALLYLGRSYRALGEKSQAIKAYSRLIGLVPNHEEARKVLSELTGS